jgi:hypothetical protein
MNWRSFVKNQTNYCIEHPIGSAVSTAFFGFIAGMQFSELWFRQHPVPIGEYAFVLVFVILTTGQSYFVARALRVTHTSKEQID